MNKNLSIGLFVGYLITTLIVLLLPSSSITKEVSFFSFIPHFDKIFHCILFGGFAYLLSRMLLFSDFDFRKILYITFFISLIFAVFTEFLQLWTFSTLGRTFDVYDIYADGVGIIIALVFVLWTYKE